jgi:hypothetical protein
MNVMDDLIDTRHLEPTAQGLGDTRDQLLASIAISLKRLADGLQPDVITSAHAPLENLVWDLGRAFGRGVELGKRE